MRHPGKFSIMLLALTAVMPSAIAGEKQVEDPAALIRHAVEASDIWSTGAVRLRVHVKFVQVKAGEINADYEKIWISPKQWRAQFTSAEFNEVSVGGDGKVWESPSPEKPLRVREFERALAALSQTVVSDGLRYSSREVRLNGRKDKATCVQVDDNQRPLVQDCFDPDTGLLLQVSDHAANWIYTYSDYQPFAGKQFPRTIGVIEGYTPVAIVQVVGLDATTSSDAKLFAPPAGAEVYNICPEALGFSLGAKGGKLVKRIDPVPPRLVSNGLVHSSIMVLGVVGRDGKFRSLAVRGLEKIANDAVSDAVRQWHYEPFTVCGNPVEMPTTITVNFTNVR
jgi:hypothetical protein